MSRRIRKHANPFNVQTRLGRLDRASVFGREAPLEVDIGCGGGGFILQRAHNHPDVDFIGFEVRKPLVEDANRRAAGRGLKNALFVYANALPNLDGLVDPGVIRRFFIQFPDPCFKKRHHKRRILQPELARRMAELLPVGGEVFVQSDVRPLAEEMRDFLGLEGAFESRLSPELTVPSPFEEKTEWERHHESASEPVYRMLFVKVREPAGEVPRVEEYRDTNPHRVHKDGSRVEAG